MTVAVNRGTIYPATLASHQVAGGILPNQSPKINLYHAKASKLLVSVLGMDPITCRIIIELTRSPGRAKPVLGSVA